MVISRELLDEILMRNDIEQLIGGYVSLKRAGSTLKGLCPFHSEKTPSFVVYPRDNSFYCFGCGVGGNAVTFVRQIEHLDYVDAVEFLAKRVGITVPHDTRDSDAREYRVEKKRVIEMNVEAAHYFHKCLFSESADAKAALSYFTEKRGLSLATIRHFGLGFAPDSYDAFVRYMRSKGYRDEELVAGFLAGRSSSGSVYAAFRNRVMFPIIDVTGNVIAFGGRVMDNSTPKYRNSSDTPAFKKSRNLFALNFARLTCAESLILCEGYMDVIALHAAGFTNAVATLGTAITPEQARIMSKYTKKVIICYDSDEPGQKAAQRALRILGEVGVDVGVLRLPGAKDPDEFIRAQGKEKFRECLEQSQSRFEYNMTTVLSRYNLEFPQDKINALGELVSLISGVNSEAERDIYIREVAKRLEVEPRSLRADVDLRIRRNRAARAKEESQQAREAAQGYNDRVNRDYIKAPALAHQEENVLGLLLLYPEHVRTVMQEGLLTEDDFFTAFNKKVFRYIRDCYEQGYTAMSDMDRDFTQEEVGRIARMKIARMELSDNSETVLRECVAALRACAARRASESISSLTDLDSLLNKMREEKI